MALQPPSGIRTGCLTRNLTISFRQDADRFCVPGYPAVIHRLTYRRHNHENLHVRGYKEEAPRPRPRHVRAQQYRPLQLALDAIKRVRGWRRRLTAAEQWYSEAIQRHKLYVAENGDDLPEIKDWRWSKS